MFRVVLYCVNLLPCFFFTRVASIGSDWTESRFFFDFLIFDIIIRRNTLLCNNSSNFVADYVANSKQIASLIVLFRLISFYMVSARIQN